MRNSTIAIIGLALVSMAFVAFLWVYSGSFQWVGEILHSIEMGLRAEVPKEEMSPREENVVSGVSSGVPVSSNADEEAVAVMYTDEGFSPFTIEVVAGTAVRFVNNSSKALWVTSRAHPTALQQNYEEFDSARSIGHGEAYTFTFTKVGVWGYKNLNAEDHLGAVVVIPQ